MSAPTPSAGAVRAAEAIQSGADLDSPPQYCGDIEEMAAIIDREAGVKEFHHWLSYYRKLMPGLCGLSDAAWLSTAEGQGVTAVLSKFTP